MMFSSVRNYTDNVMTVVMEVNCFLYACRDVVKYVTLGRTKTGEYVISLLVQM